MADDRSPLQAPNIDYFFLCCREWPLSRTRVIELLNGRHSNAEHVATKYTSAPDFKTFLQSCDPIAAACFFGPLAIRGQLPETYLAFWTWLDDQGIDIGRWSDCTIVEKSILISRWPAPQPHATPRENVWDTVS